MPTPDLLDCRRRAGASAVLAVLALLGGCGLDDPTPRPSAAPPTTTAPATTSSRRGIDEQALRRLATGWYETIQSIYVDGAAVEGAEAYIAGEYLERFAVDVADRRRAGLTSRRGDASRQVVAEVDVGFDDGLLTTCTVDANVLIADDGDVLDDDVVTSWHETAALRTPDGWRFTRRTALAEPEEGATCDG